MKGNFSKNEANNLPVLTLAYIGDAVYELLLRQYFLNQGVLKSQRLHQKMVDTVCAGSQAQLAFSIIDDLNDEELAIYKRGRNAKSGHHPANASVIDYRSATGLEALIGYWYLTGEEARIDWLLSKLFCGEAER